MCANDFLHYFNRIYILRAVTASSRETWDQHRFDGQWLGKTASGCINNTTWLGNPQYMVRTKEPDTQVFINLSQPDLRYTLKKNMETIRSLKQSYQAIGLYILKTDDKDFKKVRYVKEDKKAVSPFTDVRDLSFEYTIQTPGDYVVMPCTFDHGIESSYELSIFVNKPADVHELTREKPSKSIHGQWRGPTAGGCMNFDTWIKNPQFLLVCSKPGPVEILLQQIAVPGKELEAIALYVLSGSSEARIAEPDCTEPILIKPKAIGTEAAVSEVLNADAREYYIIVPTVFDPDVEREFVLTVASTDDKVEVFREL